MESVSVSEDLGKQSAFMPCTSSNSLEAQQHEETRLPDEGKRKNLSDKIIATVCIIIIIFK